MELSDVIFGSRIRAVILALVVSAAVAISSVLTLQEPREYSSTVAFVAPSTNRGNPSAVDQAVANLRANLGAGSVVRAAAEASGIPLTEVRSHLALSRRGASDTVELSFTSDRRGIAEVVVEDAAKALVEEVTAVDIERAGGEAERLRAEVEAVQDQFDTFMADNGLAIPDEEFRNLSSELTALRVALANAVIDNSARVAALQQAVTQREAALDELAPKVRRYQDLNLELDRAQRRLDAALDSEAAVASLLATVAPGALVPDREHEVPRGSEVARAAAGAGGVAVVICLLLFAMVEVRRAGAVRRRDRAGEPASPAVPPVRAPAPPAAGLAPTSGPVVSPAPYTVPTDGTTELRSHDAQLGRR